MKLRPPSPWPQVVYELAARDDELARAREEGLELGRKVRGP